MAELIKRGNRDNQEREKFEKKQQITTKQNTPMQIEHPAFTYI